jgi:hypothetical protein
MADEETVDNLRSEEVTADDKEDDGDIERKTFLRTAILFKLWT